MKKIFELRIYAAAIRLLIIVVPTLVNGQQGEWKVWVKTSPCYRFIINLHQALITTKALMVQPPVTCKVMERLVAVLDVGRFKKQ